MNHDLTEEQVGLLKQLRPYESEVPFHSLTDLNISKREGDLPATQHWDFESFNEMEYDEQHEQIKQKLFRYRQKAEKIYKIGQLLKSYQTKFSGLISDKNQLLQMISRLKGETSELVAKQKSMLDLSIHLKEALDYYAYFDKFEFGFACDVSNREMFEDILQPKLSELSDGIEYFQQNSNYVSAKRQLSLFQNGRAKVLTFAKNFLIKLFNKQYGFVTRFSKTANLSIDCFYPKSKAKFIAAFLVHFPQFKHNLKFIIRAARQGATETEAQSLQNREVEIEQFQLSESNLALINYLQKNVPEVYEEAVLNFLSFHRLNLHETVIKNAGANLNRQATYSDVLKQRYILMGFMVSSEYIYLLHCGRISLPFASQSAQKTVQQIAQLYSQDLKKWLKDARNKQPFDVCDRICEVSADYGRFIDNHLQEQYQSYAFGAISKGLKEEDIRFMKDLFQSFIHRHLQELESICLNSLPKLAPTNRKEVIEAVKVLIEYFPRLKYCPLQAERYVIASLECLIRVIRQTNAQIDSRFQCYVWNLQIFGNLRIALKELKVKLVRKELKLDTQNSVTVLDRVRQVERNESILKYAQDVLNVLKTGMPVINELTMDFAKYITEHYNSLETQFVKDILFIYAKNMVEFLQKLTDSQNKSQELCQVEALKIIYASYLLSVEKYIKDSKEMLQLRRQFTVGQASLRLIMDLMEEVYDRIFDLLDRFYVMTSKHVGYIETFQEIDSLKKRFTQDWLK